MDLWKRGKRRKSGRGREGGWEIERVGERRRGRWDVGCRVGGWDGWVSGCLEERGNGGRAVEREGEGERKREEDG